MIDEYSEAVSDDYGVILKNGEQLTLDEIVGEFEKLQQRIEHLESGKESIEKDRVAISIKYNNQIKYVKQLENLLSRIIEAYCLVDGSMAEDDCNRLWEQIDIAQEKLEK